MYSQKNSSHLRRVTALAVVLAILLQITLLCLASSAAPSGDASGRKIRISSASVAADVSARGGKLIADYGTFQVFRLDASLANSLDDKVVDSLADDDRILLNTGTLDTTTE
ncbi:MAG TPA: hypothetical protein VLT36_01550, partial [Candidatus Dormibacteraeota bacterium]|nr:hypothetical protein [Candidatus Dormibacteraeota bacterium]